MGRIVFLILFFISGGNLVAQTLTPGTWDAQLSPGAHPEMETRLNIIVNYKSDKLEITIVGPDNELIKTTNNRVDNDELYFQFIEPEDNQLLTCILKNKDHGQYSGKCQDRNGKWALLEMVAP